MAVKQTQPRGGKRARVKSVKASSEYKFLRVKLVRSLIGRPQKQREVINGLGLRRLQSEVIRKDCPEIWGMIRKVQHLVRVEKVKEK